MTDPSQSAAGNEPTPANYRSVLFLETLAIGFLIAAFVYLFPRFLILKLGAENPWTSYLYQYSFGFIFFSTGLWLILKTGACKFGRGRDTLWFSILVGGFILFSSIHAIWVYMAITVPVKGG